MALVFPNVASEQIRHVCQLLLFLLLSFLVNFTDVYGYLVSKFSARSKSNEQTLLRHNKCILSALSCVYMDDCTHNFSVL